MYMHMCVFVGRELGEGERGERGRREKVRGFKYFEGFNLSSRMFCRNVLRCALPFEDKGERPQTLKNTPKLSFCVGSVGLINLRH